jgi:hypothetical protein
VRTAYAEIIRQGDAFKKDVFYAYGSESFKTKTKAMETLSTSEYYKGKATGFIDSLIVSPIKSLIEALRPLAMQQAYIEGNATLQDVEQMQDEVSSKLKNVYAALSNPDVLSKIPQTMRNSIADAIEKGDARALGKIDGEVLGFVASLAVPGGGIVGSTGKVTKTTEVLTDVGRAGEKVAAEVADQVPGRIQSRINIANGRTATTPLRDNGNPVSAGFDHVLEGHFDVPISNSRSVFSVTPDELKSILQSEKVLTSSVTALGDGQFVRTVDVGRVIGTTSLKEGGAATSILKVFTDRAGNLITTFPVKGGK